MRIAVFPLIYFLMFDSFSIKSSGSDLGFIDLSDFGADFSCNTNSL